MEVPTSAIFDHFPPAAGGKWSQIADVGTSELKYKDSKVKMCIRDRSYADAQPGDLICYGGHVAIYMGNGRIVHASNSVDGIKICLLYTSKRI